MNEQRIIEVMNLEIRLGGEVKLKQDLNKSAIRFVEMCLVQM